LEKKELYSMTKHRGLILGLALAALIGLSARDAQAGDLTINVSWASGPAGGINISVGSPFALPDSTSNFVDVNLPVLNASLTGSAYLSTDPNAGGFLALNAQSNNPGSATGANIKLDATAQLASATGDNTITVVASQTGFMSPSGAGVLTTANSGNFTNYTVGDSQTSFSSVNSVDTTPHNNYVVPAGAPNPYSAAMGGTAGATVSSGGYTLSDTTTITLALSGFNASNPGSSATDQTTNSATFRAVPEPAGLVMMVTGMPLPLVVMGLLRRRRAAA